MIPLKITCRNFSVTDSIRTEVEAFVSKLDRFYDRIMHCEVSISAPHRHQRKGRLYHVAIRLLMPGPDLMISRKVEDDPSHEKLHTALNHAFHAMERRLEDRVRTMRGYVKGREAPTVGRVLRVFPDRGFGFLEGDDGQEIYFHEHSVLNRKFSELQEGNTVRYRLEKGEKGPQASSLQLLSKTESGSGLVA
jgi:ribosomal subunit interface protein